MSQYYEVERDCALQAFEINTVDENGVTIRQIQVLDTEIEALLIKIAVEFPWKLAALQESVQHDG